MLQNHSNSLIPLEEQAEFIPFLEKYIIPKEKKKELRDTLLENNYTKEWLLQEIDSHLKKEIENLISKYKI